MLRSNSPIPSFSQPPPAWLWKCLRIVPDCCSVRSRVPLLFLIYCSSSSKRCCSGSACGSGAAWATHWLGMAPIQLRDWSGPRRPRKWDKVFYLSRREGRGEGYGIYRRWCALEMTSPSLALLSSRGQARGFGHKRSYSRCCLLVLSWWYFVTKYLLIHPAIDLEKILSDDRVNQRKVMFFASHF